MGARRTGTRSPRGKKFYMESMRGRGEVVSGGSFTGSNFIRVAFNDVLSPVKGIMRFVGVVNIE